MTLVLTGKDHVLEGPRPKTEEKEVPGICTHFFHYMYIRLYKYVSSHPPLVHGISDYNSFGPCQWMPMVKGLTLHH